MGQTVFSKIWDSHQLAERPDGQSLIYIDRHITHEVTSPLAFESLRASGRSVRRPDLTFAVMDHNVPTGDRTLPVADPMSQRQMAALAANTGRYGITLFDYDSPDQGISHVVGPELGLTLPGITLTCGDSHTSTHGALGALALGIGTSEGEHVLATQTLWMKKPREMEIRMDGEFQPGVLPKDAVMWVIREMGTGGAIGHVVQFRGAAVEGMSLEQRMTIANMIIEGGARTAIIEPDEQVYDYLRGTRFAPTGGDWDAAEEHWRTLVTDSGARFDSSRSFDVGSLEPQASWGTNPAMTVGVSECVPRAEDFEVIADRLAADRALKYMGLRGGERVSDIRVDRVFIGSCTNARLSDLIDAARVVLGRKVARGVRAMVVPGSQRVKRAAEQLRLDRVFTDAGFEWRNSGCSLCIGMNDDKLAADERCASTSNRNFENRQGPGGRTHLVSPYTAAAAAVTGTIADPRDFALASDVELDLGGF
ncbi:MAG: 3-isopropylmalate dehydratase large subunit [Nitrososphaerota archaeon]|nr:3-isopropylmalate dehydratase large subunit [Nitrososphaerota archaeon]